MATPEEERFQFQAALIEARDARLQLRPRPGLERLERTLQERRLELVPLRIQYDVVAELGALRLEVGDQPGAEREFIRCRELMSRGQMEPSIPASTCVVGAARVHLQAGRFAEAEQVLLPVAVSWEHVNPLGSGRGVVLHWLARAEHGLGKEAAAHRDEQLARSLLQRSALPALRRLADARSSSR